MKTKKLFLIIALVVGCAVGAHAQKTVFKFRDAQARAGDAVTEVCVKPTVVEVKILEDKGRIKDEWTLSKEEVEIAMKGELDNIRAWGASVYSGGKSDFRGGESREKGIRKSDPYDST